jgi:hypothetical protein
MPPVRFEVPRVSSDVDPREFIDKYYVPRRPVVIEGVASHWPASRDWTRDYLMETLERCADRATRQLLWWDIDRTLIAADVPEPTLIDALRRQKTPRERARSRRLWMSRGGERTPWHYDGNSLEIFNAQVIGSKRFTLVSPHTPIDLEAFSLLGRRPEALPETLLTDAHDYTSFELRAGDLLYLPRHWFHFVESLADFNANINWVWTDLSSGSLDNPVSRREQELVAGFYSLLRLESRLTGFFRVAGAPRLRLKHLSPEYTSEYGGLSNFQVAREFLRERGWVRSAWTLLRESFVSLRLKRADRARR